MREILGNILSIKAGIIAHQVNCKGVMNAGLAKSLRDKYPVIYPSYHLGGGDWAVISQLIEDWCPEATVVRLPQS